MTVKGLQFVDMNILVYAHDVSAGVKHTIAKALFKDLWETKNGCISVQVLQEFFVTVTQKIRNPISGEVAGQIIFALSIWHVDAPSPADVLSAIQIQQKHQVSLWDAMILQSAQAMGCKTLWSEDFSPRLYDDIQVINPFQ